jgi:hypothetical protein
LIAGDWKKNAPILVLLSSIKASMPAQWSLSA